MGDNNMINKQNTEIREQHYMDAEGSEDNEMTFENVADYLYQSGYNCFNIDIVYDHLQGVWRWSADIERI